MDGALNRTVELVVKYSGDAARIGTIPGAVFEDLSLGYGIVTVPRDRAEEVGSLPGIEDVEPSRELFIGGAFSLNAACIERASGADGLSGAGVAVGVIDTGIDYAHPEFIGEDGRSRIALMWDQDSSVREPPTGFTFGAEYTAAEFDAALNAQEPYLVIPRTDLSGHGTAVAAIAAGNGGAAPGAEIIAVRIRRGESRGGAPTTDIMRGLKYTVDRARERDLPLACNVSFGMNDGSHRGDSLFETYITDLASSWKCSVTVPTGNEGSSGHHASGVIRSGEIREIEFFTAPGIPRFFLSLWKDFADEVEYELIFPNGESAGRVGVLDGVADYVSGNAALTAIYGQPNRYSVRQEVFFEIRAADGGLLDAGAWTLRMYAGEAPNGSYDIWLPTVGEVTEETYFSFPTVSGSLTLPSTAEKVISVAGYNARTGAAAPFSGVGFTGSGQPAPDVAAPAVGVVSARSGGGYASFTGTSFASPFVCGAAALMMEWGIVRGNAPFMYGERVRAFIRLGATRRPSSPYPDPYSGYGTLCFSRTLDYMRRYAPVFNQRRN